MNSPVTFIQLPPSSAVYKGYEIGLAENPNGYCCDGSLLDLAKPLCATLINGETGCFTSLGIPGTTDDVFGKKTYCDDQPGDDFCMVETCLEENQYDVCEVFNSCDDTAKTVSYQNSELQVLCESYGSDYIPSALDNSNYFDVDQSCTTGGGSSWTTNCEAVTRMECTGGGNCQALCQIDEDEVRYNCQEVCEEYDCVEVTSYHGGECVIPEQCNPTPKKEYSDYIDPLSVSGCEIMGVCNQFGCAADECTAYGCPESTLFKKLDTLCKEEFYCTTLNCNELVDELDDVNLQCFLERVSNGNPLVLNITETSNSILFNTYYRCDPEPTIETGDPWCEYGTDQNLEFNPSSGRCEHGFEVCDFGSSNQPSNNGCNDLILEKTDYWGSYDSDCVVESVTSSYDNVYDQVCCYAYTIDDFDIYDDALSNNNAINGVRVY